MPFEDEHSCRLEDPDAYDEFRRENDAATVDGRQVDHVFGIEGEVNVDLQAIRYPFRNGWDTDAAFLEAQQHCEERDGLAFEPAEGFTSASCLSCGEIRDHDMKPTTKHSTVEPVGVTTREIRGEEREVLRVPISSTHTDREGDRFTKEALEGMAEQIREQQPLLFQNHGLAGNFMEAIPYDQAETIGTHFDAEVESEKDGDTTHHTLYSFINPDKTHPEGERMLKQVRDEKQAIKFSVGFKIHDHDPIEDDAGNEIGRAFTDVDLMEDSKVGVPANPQASVTVESAAKGGNPAMSHPLMQLLAQQTDVQQASGARVATKTADGDEADDTPEARDADEAGEDEPTLAALREELDALHREVEGLYEVIETDETDADPEGEGEAEADAKEPVDRDTVEDATPVEMDGQDEFDPEYADDVDDLEALTERLEELRAAVRDGPGDSETGDPTTDDAADLVDETDDAAPDETSSESTDDETSGHTHITDLL